MSHHAVASCQSYSTGQKRGSHCLDGAAMKKAIFHVKTIFQPAQETCWGWTQRHLLCLAQSWPDGPQLGFNFASLLSRKVKGFQASPAWETQAQPSTARGMDGRRQWGHRPTSSGDSFSRRRGMQQTGTSREHYVWPEASPPVLMLWQRVKVVFVSHRRTCPPDPRPGPWSSFIKC